ncbi:MAG: hypothetical protein ACU0DW_06310 [Shimia sp.]
MAENVENQTIHLLQEMRAEMRERFDEMNKRFDEVDERFADVNNRIDGLSYIVTLLAADFGRNDDRIDTLEEQVKRLEQKVEAQP